MHTRKTVKTVSSLIQKPGASAFFTTQLLNWHQHQNNRQMPWKGERNPYKIWLSEVILQQTRVEQGWPYYLRLIEHYPTVSRLAAAKDEAVFKLWEGLGYYSRCRNLLAAARQIMTIHGGQFPDQHHNILHLKGVGAYTAAAIASFAFNQPYAVVDGNVTRLLARYFGIDEPVDSTQGKKTFAALAQKLIAKDHAASYNQAIMDFGATVCKPVNPDCSQCPLQKKCRALATRQVHLLPVKSKKIQKRDRWLFYTIIKGPAGTLVKERLQKDIWKHLFDFPGMERSDFAEYNHQWWEKWVLTEYGLKAHCLHISEPHTQALTHQNIKAVFIQFATRTTRQITPFEWCLPERLVQLPFPKIIRQYVESGK